MKMRQIKQGKAANSVTIDLNSFFYPLHIVQATSAEFSRVAKVTVRKAHGRVLVSLKPKGKENAKETALHFCNFALGLKRELGEHA